MKSFLSIGILCMGLLMGCDEAGFEGDALDIRNGPPPVGRVGEAYSFQITARIKHTSGDSDYVYSYSHVDGSLPPGTDFVHREGVTLVTGSPTQAGQYTFVVGGTAFNPKANASDAGAFRSLRDEQLFTITIEP